MLLLLGLAIFLHPRCFCLAYLLPGSLVLTRARILFLVSLLFVALLDPLDPYSPFKFLIFYLSLYTRLIKKLKI